VPFVLKLIADCVSQKTHKMSFVSLHVSTQPGMYVPSLISLVDSIRSPKRSPSLKLYVMHLVELTDRSSSIMMARRTRKNGFPFKNRFAAAFEAYGQVSRVNIRHSTAISSLATMQDDICHIAQEKRVAMIILPFHKQWSNIWR
jgi:hypothetical protein